MLVREWTSLLARRLDIGERHGARAIRARRRRASCRSRVGGGRPGRPAPPRPCELVAHPGPLAPRLAGAHRLAAPDQRGHGRSGKPSSGYGFDRLTTDAVAVIRDLRLGRPLVVGHSWGASVALQLAVRKPRRVAGAILLDGGFSNMRDRMDWPTARRVLAPPDIDGMPLERFLEWPRRAMSGLLTVTPEIEDVFRSLVRVDRHGRIHRRLSVPNHLRILHAMWAEDTVGAL
ncbi:MAG TPA: alpha/beta hydrolase, partial [Actinomycetota bacterium]